MKKAIKLPWKIVIFSSALLLTVLSFMDSYGLYTGRLYFFDLGNYVFPLLSVLHFIFLYIIWFKIEEEEYPDAVMRNLEYILYFALFIYGYKTFETISIIAGHSPDENLVYSENFFPLAYTKLFLHVLLMAVTLYTFNIRKHMIGVYNHDYLNEPIDS